MQYGVGASRRYAGYAAYHHHIRLHCDPLTPFVATPEYEQAGQEVGIETVQSNADWKILMGLSIQDPSDRPDAFSKFASEFRKLYRTPTFEGCPSFIPRKIDINWWSSSINILERSSSDRTAEMEINMSIYNRVEFLLAYVGSSFFSLHRARSFEGCSSSFILGRVSC